MTTTLLTPGERLTLSRERLRQAMARSDSPTGDGTGAGGSPSGLGLLDVLKLAIPSAGVVIDAIDQWWRGHPLQATGNLAGNMGDGLLRPLAQRHPLALAAGAAALGALLVWARPWRWARTPSLLAALAPGLLSSAWASTMVQTWVLAAMAQANPSTKPETEPAPTATP